MMLYVLHRAVFCEEIECRRSEILDRKAIEELLLVMPTRQEILADFDLTMDPLQSDKECFIFKCNDTIFGFAILWSLYILLQFFSLEKLEFSFCMWALSSLFCYSVEKQVDFIRRYYHVEDYVSMQSIRQNEYGHLLHFVLMPIFSAYHRFFFREIARLSELTVIFYRFHHEDENTLVSFTIIFLIFTEFYNHYQIVTYIYIIHVSIVN